MNKIEIAFLCLVAVICLITIAFLSVMTYHETHYYDTNKQLIEYRNGGMIDSNAFYVKYRKNC